jgi:CBS domain containing-hemolysin-like protein
MVQDNPEPGNRQKAIRSILNRLFRKKDNSFNFRDYDKLDGLRKEMIKGVVSLSEKIARDIMIPRVDIVAVEHDIELKPLVRIVCDAGHSRVPVFEDKIDNIIGMLYVKDLLKLLIDGTKKKFTLRKILHEPYFVPETMPLDELMLEFKARKLHIAVVVDEYGGVDGIITLEDILEEIVGDINDEFDSEELPEFEPLGKNLFDVDSRMTIEDFNQSMSTALPEEEFDTIGGFVLDLFGKIPDKDETVKYQNLTFKIKDITGTIINRITVSAAKTGKKG